jgi:hypothetical protein
VSYATNGERLLSLTAIVASLQVMVVRGVSVLTAPARPAFFLYALAIPKAIPFLFALPAKLMYIRRRSTAWCPFFIRSTCCCSSVYPKRRYHEEK